MRRYTSVSYKFVGTKPADGDAFYTYFSIDTNGNVGITDAGKDGTDETKLSSAAIAYLNSSYSTLGTLVYTAELGHDGIDADNNKYNLTVSELPYGYYYITTTTGTVVSVDTVKPSATTEDKNPGTSVDKEIMGATGTIANDAESAFAQVGTVVTYEARIPIQNGARNYVFKDTMTNGLTLDASSVQVFLTDTNAAVAANATADGQYGTLTAANQTAENTPDITIDFNQNWITANVGKDIVVRYKGTVNENGLQKGVNGNPNKAEINWGDTSNFLHDDDENKVYNAEISVVKYDATQATKTPLAGAGFKLYRNVTSGGTTTKEYYKWVAGSNGAAPTIEWTTDAAQATEYITKADGKLSTAANGTDVKYFEGLCDGTYYLEESTIPAGFNSITDTEVTIAANNFTTENLQQVMNVDNKKGAELPSTGGSGTTMIYIIGVILLAGAGILLVTRRRMKAE